MQSDNAIVSSLPVTVGMVVSEIMTTLTPKKTVAVTETILWKQRWHLEEHKKIAMAGTVVIPMDNAVHEIE